MKINFILPFPDKFALIRQISQELSAIHEVGINNYDDSIVWDIIVVYERMLKDETFRCKDGGLVFITGEPPLMNCYPKNFLKQFDLIITSHKSLVHENLEQSQQSLPWLIGESDGGKYTYEFFKDFTPKKGRNISTICSFKNILPGHSSRNKLIRDIIDNYSEIDLYGRSYNFIEDKIEALSDYRFHLCVENSKVDDYWTEKLSDPILALSVPLYIGCTNVANYFTKEEIIDCTSMTFSEIKECIDRILENPELEYKRRLPHLLNARKKILNNYNIVETVLSKVSLSEKVNTRDICAYQNTNIYKIKLFQIKALRKILMFLGL